VYTDISPHGTVPLLVPLLLASPFRRAQYLEAFNEHSYTDVRACLSSGLEMYVKGNLVEKDKEHIGHYPKVS